MPIYPNPGGKEVVETDKDMDMFKIRVSYEWTKQDVGGKKIRIKYGQPGAKSAPAKVFIELGGKKSIVHDENWEHFLISADLPIERYFPNELELFATFFKHLTQKL